MGRGAVSSWARISWQRSMHSSQMWTPGPAISFLTCRWLLPQKLQSSCSFPSDALAIGLLLDEFAGSGYPRRDRIISPMHQHTIDEPVLLGLLRGHEVV